VSETYTYDDVVQRFVPGAARRIAWRYRAYGVELEDVKQEMFVWLYGEGERRVRKWLRNSPQQTTRITRSLEDAGITYGEAEKAARVGYEPDDVMWYSPALVEGLMPLVLDETFDGEMPVEGAESGRKSKQVPHEAGNGLVMVLDIRRALDKLPEWVSDVFRHEERGMGRWEDAVLAVVNYLGGSSPHVGKRKVLANATAKALTDSTEAGQ
jgi:hypothetical protein